MAFYGIALNTGSLPGNIYTNSFFVAIMDIPGVVLAHVTVNRIGRRWSYCVSLSLGGLACCCSVFVVLFAQPGTGAQRHVWQKRRIPLDHVFKEKITKTSS